MYNAQHKQIMADAVAAADSQNEPQAMSMGRAATEKAVMELKNALMAARRVQKAIKKAQQYSVGKPLEELRQLDDAIDDVLMDLESLMFSL